MNKSAGLLLVLLLTGAEGCGARRVPEAAGVAPGTPYVSWVIMHGDRDNPDREYACQSHPRNDCVVPVSRPDAQVFSDVHVYYHAAGQETRYVGSVNIGYFQGSSEALNTPTSMTVTKNQSIANQSVTGIVSSTPGTYAVSFELEASVTEAGTKELIRDEIPVVVK